MAVCLLAGLVVVTVPFVEHSTLYALVLGILLCLLGPLAFSWFRGRLDIFETIHVYGLIYFVFFGLGAVWTVGDPSYVAYDVHIVPYVPRAVLYCLIGYVALLAAYYGPWFSRDYAPAPPARVRGPLLLMIAGGLGIVGYGAGGIVERAILLGGSVGIFGTLAQLSPFFLVAWALGWLLVFSGQATRAQRMVLFGFLGAGALFTATTTFSDKSLLMTLIGIPIIARWYARRKVPWSLLLVLLLVLIFVVFPFYNTYRWSDPTMGQMNRMVATYETIRGWDSDLYLRFSLRMFTRRLAMVNSVAVVVRDVPRWVPYAKGDTIFLPVVMNFIPRVVWPDKPVSTLGREFGRLFRVTNMFTKTTYIGPTIPGELYWNFDVPGVIIGMALLGLTMRFLYRRYGEAPTVDPVRQAIHIYLVIQVLHIGDVAGGIVGVVRTLILLEALFWLGRQYGFIGSGGEPAASGGTVAGRP
jgi:hypothetical protein